MATAKKTSTVTHADPPAPKENVGTTPPAAPPGSTTGTAGGDANVEGEAGVANVVTANPTLGEDTTRAAENPRLNSAGVKPPTKKERTDALKADDRPEAQDRDPNSFEGTVEERAAAAPPREDWQ